MVTSNKLSDKKVVKMGEHDHNNIAVVIPQRTLLGEVNEHITCPLCRGYYIDATTIVECLHSFCRSCIIKHLQVKSYCPVCEMMINSAKPNIKLDKALQDIVYKLVPGLFQKEMERRQQFYASRPGTAASATPEQRGEDTERIIFSPEDVISFSLEYADLTDADSISSRSSDSNEPQNSPATTRRYLQCPAVVNISHLKKFLSMKFDIDSTQFAIDILYKRVPLSDYYTLMDIAYIFNWKRNEPMRFFYQIIDYVAIRNRLFDINRKSSHFHDRKSSPASTEDTNVSSPAPHLNDQGSEASSGTDSPMPDDSSKHCGDSLNKTDNLGSKNKIIPEKSSNSSEMSPKKMDEDVEKSQFLNSFELTPKSNCVPVKSSPSKSTIPDDKPTQLIESTQKTQINLPEKAAKVEEKHPDTLKRKNSSTLGTPEFKKLKVELEKAKISHYINYPGAHQSLSNQPEKSKTENTVGEKQTDGAAKGPQIAPSPNNSTSTSATKDIKQQHQIATNKQVTENPVMKRPVMVSQNTSSPKRKPSNEGTSSAQLSSSLTPKAVSPLKLQIPKLENQSSNPNPKPGDISKPPIKKMPDLKPSGSMSQSSQGKSPTVNKVRMDLLANNSDPTIDRSKILSQVKSSLNVQSTGQASGDPLKSLFDSCKINIPSSLSITLTDQKLDNRVPSDASNVEVKKNIVNKNITAASNTSHKVPSPPVHNYIEILKLPDTDAKKQTKSDITSDTKSNPHKLEATTSQPKPNTKTSETSAKGPIPNLKPIADTKLGKQSGSFSAPITFQQTFEQQLQSMQCDKKPKLPKSKTQVPKLVPATPKSLSAVNKPNLPINKPVSSNSSTDSKTSTALDLSTPHNIQTQLGSQQTFDKALETMQTIANLAKKQNLPSKLSVSMPHNNVFPSMVNRTMTTGVSSLRVPSTNTINQIKLDKMNALATHVSNNSRSDSQNKTNQMKLSNNGSPTMSPLNYPSHASASTAQPSPRSQTRSPSSSPKLVIAEEKQVVNSLTDHTMNQSNQISSTQLTNVHISKSESPKASPGPSKTGLKPGKPMTSGKVAAIWQPLTPTMKSNQTMSSPSDFLSQQLTRQMEVNAWIKAQRQFEYIKNMSNMAHQAGSDFNNQDKQ